MPTVRLWMCIHYTSLKELQPTEQWKRRREKNCWSILSTVRRYALCVMFYVLCSNSNRALKFFIWMPSNRIPNFFWDNTCCLSIARWWFKFQVLSFVIKTNNKNKKLFSMFHMWRSSNIVLDCNGCSLVDKEKNSKNFTWKEYASYQWWHTLLHFISQTRNIDVRQAWPRLYYYYYYLSSILIPYGLWIKSSNQCSQFTVTIDGLRSIG